MKKQIKVTLIVIVAAIIAAAIIWYVMYLRGKEQDLLTPVGTRAEFIGDTDKYPTMLTAKGTQILNADGEQVVLKGVMVPESRSLYEEKKVLMARFTVLVGERQDRLRIISRI